MSSKTTAMRPSDKVHNNPVSLCPSEDLHGKTSTATTQPSSRHDSLGATLAEAGVSKTITEIIRPFKKIRLLNTRKPSDERRSDPVSSCPSDNTRSKTGAATTQPSSRHDSLGATLVEANVSNTITETLRPVKKFRLLGPRKPTKTAARSTKQRAIEPPPMGRSLLPQPETPRQSRPSLIEGHLERLRTAQYYEQQLKSLHGTRRAEYLQDMADEAEDQDYYWDYVCYLYHHPEDCPPGTSEPDPPWSHRAINLDDSNEAIEVRESSQRECFGDWSWERPVSGSGGSEVDVGPTGELPP